MEKGKGRPLFWVSYADLMTSLFFVMFALFMVTGVLWSKDEGVIKDLEGAIAATEAEKKQLDAINEAIHDLDDEYFGYSEQYKKHQLKIEVNFLVDQYLISCLSEETRTQLKTAGRILKDFIDKKTSENRNIQFLLIIEGQASLTGPEGHNYLLSYRRAYQLKKFWEDQGIDFTARNCEVIIAGSGDGRQSGTGLMRERREALNQRFLIHILPKPGYIDETKSDER